MYPRAFHRCSCTVLCAWGYAGSCVWRVGGCGASGCLARQLQEPLVYELARVLSDEHVHALSNAQIAPEFYEGISTRWRCEIVPTATSEEEIRQHVLDGTPVLVPPEFGRRACEQVGDDALDYLTGAGPVPMSGVEALFESSVLRSFHFAHLPLATYLTRLHTCLRAQATQSAMCSRVQKLLLSPAGGVQVRPSLFVTRPQQKPARRNFCRG